MQQQAPPDSPKILPMSEWLPDQPAFGNPGSTSIINAVPQSLSSYGPISSLLPVGVSGIPADQTVLGVFYFIDNHDGAHIFVGTENHLYHLTIATGDFVDATNLGVAYHASVDSTWQMTSFANSVIAVNAADQPQILTIGDLTFSTISAAPFAKCVATVKDFLVLGNLVELSDGVSYPQRLRWSAIGDATNYPPIGTEIAGELQSDISDLRSDLGQIRGIASNLQSADMAVFFDNGLYTGIYVGSPAIFNFQIAQGATGCRIPNSIVVHRGYAYYLSQTGWMAFDGTSPRPIGSQKIDNFFFNDPLHGLDISFIDRVQGAADPTNKLIYWLYHGPNSGGVANRILIYNWSLDRWGLAMMSASWLAKSISLGYTLEQLDQFGNLENLPFPLDSPAWQGGAPGMYAFDASSPPLFSRFGGPNLAATMDTAEIQLSPGTRAKVTNTRPLVDGRLPSTPTVALGYRSRLEDQVTYNSPRVMNQYGQCNHLVDSRYFRGRVAMPAGQKWTHCMGVEIDFTKTTRR